MRKTKLSHKIMSAFLMLTFLPSILPVNYILANNNGPNAPEAASFEPVDATDMVNLATGDLSYVMPLLNVPSPEGGYPLALSYHAGIAMDQEASWVGLGWSLNPGALNRSVNGFPDDWGKTNVSEFFRNTGWTEEFYDVSAGATLYGVTYGLGASWGTNKAFGGEVMIGAGGVTTTLGSNGGSIGIGGTTLSMQGSTVSIGVQAGMTVGSVGGKVGQTLSYDNSTNKVSHSLSALGSYGIFSSGTNVSFSSNGSSTSSQNSIGLVGTRTSTGSVSNGDYFIQQKTKGIDINVFGQFWLKYTKTELKYSLFKTNNLSVSGSLYPYQSKMVDELRVDSGHFMDIKETFGYTDYEILGKSTGLPGSDIELPDFDNYSVSAQGLSGSIKPGYFQELSLYGRGEKPEQTDVIWTEYLSNPLSVSDADYDVNNKTFFYMDNAVSSFLRVDRTKMLKPANVTGMDEANALSFYTDNTNNYSSNVTPSGDLIKTGDRMREGNYIETFTNEEIRSNTNIGSFLEAKDVDRSDINTYVNEGIGAFKVTALDGKVYHYSLPVYHFEEYSKVFDEESEEEENFLESYKTKPYATHWLLTAITGPDYIKNNNLRDYPDEGDYGYWVRFDYGKWSDGYGWRNPKEGANVNYIPHNENYSYAWGRKQIYYLDAVKTRTHTALFVKNLRADDHSSELSSNNDFWSQGIGNFDFTYHPKKYSDDNQFKKFGQPGEVYYDSDNNPITLPASANGGALKDFTGRKSVLKYVDMPITGSLRLEKILLLKNDDITNGDVETNSGNLTNISSGTIYLNDSYSNVQAKQVGSGIPYFYYGGELYSQPNGLIHFQSNIHTNVLDVSDFQGSDLQSKAMKVIDFSYDESYPLAKNTPNSYTTSKGRLTLSALYSKGKRGVALIPPYRFEYAKPYVEYDKSFEDVWGFHKDDPDAWSLNKIITPQGSSINMVYETDEYRPVENRALKFALDVRLNDDLNPETGRLLTLPDSSGQFYIDAREHFGMKVGDNFYVRYFYLDDSCNPLHGCDPIGGGSSYNEAATIMQEEGGTRFLARLNIGTVPNHGQNGDLYSIYVNYGLDKTISGSDKSFNGGGIRVKQLDVKEGYQTIYRTDYEYEGGVSSYIPLDDYQVSYASEIISPGVLYNLVTSKSINQEGELIQKTRYEFEVPEIGEPLIEVSSEYDYYFVNTSNNSTSATKTTFFDKSASIGRVKSVSHFNAKSGIVGDGQLMQKTIYEYKTDHSGDGSLGVRQESFKSYKKKTYPESNGSRNTTWDVRAISMVKYPSILESSSVIQSNESKSTYYDEHDYLTGQVVKTRFADSQGRNLKSEIKPAYHEYFGMGAKVDNLTNSNMLTQKGMDLLSISDDGSVYTPIQTQINTWKQWEDDVWRGHKSYRWIGDKDSNGKFIGFDVASDDGFDWIDSTNSPASKWERTSEITKYNSFSTPLEVMDINDNKASTKMGNEDSQIFATGNAGYDELFYSGAEDQNGTSFGGEVSLGTATVEDNLANVHTGDHSLEISSGQTGYTVSVTEGNSHVYKVSLWAKYGSHEGLTLDVGGIPTPVSYNGNEAVRAGEWIQLNFYFTVSGTQTVNVANSSGFAFVDDFRLHPVASSMTSYVYNEWGELTHILGGNNMATQYEYDEVGRLWKTYTEVEDFNGPGSGGFKRISENEYTYKN